MGSKFTDRKKLTTKDIAILSMCSIRTADRIKKLIKENIPKSRKFRGVTYADYKRFYLE